MIEMKQIASLAIILAAATIGRAEQPLRIQTVKTWSQLRETPIVARGEFGEARIGIEAIKAPQWSGVLVYCLVQPTSTSEIAGKFNHERVLGPLDCTISRRGEPRMANAMASIQRELLPRDVLELLYTRAVVIDKPGTYDVEISLRDGQEIIAKAKVIGTDDMFHPWLAFSRAGRIVDRPRRELDRKIYSASLSTKLRGIALPTHDGMYPVDWSKTNHEYADQRPLPRLIPRKISDGLKLSGGPQQLTIHSDEEMIVARPDWHYLARWWVNGDPFVPQQPQKQSMDQNGVITSGHRVQIELEFDPQDIGAKSGDVVGVQLLHLPRGWQLVMPGLDQLQAAHSESDLPRLTNRIEFVVP